MLSKFAEIVEVLDCFRDSNELKFVLFGAGGEHFRFGCNFSNFLTYIN